MTNHTLSRHRWRDPRTGRFERIYFLSHEDPDGTVHTRRMPGRGVEIFGRTLAAKAARGEAYNIAVTDTAGGDVTFDFTCFQS
ncbi:hypothetical protein [Streptomyces synnematoformans]|uniref:Uncharacterized protein n=1 Tax=Streptomyces synnematoformans TaxID=415721 RepID=A0ABN2XBD1_9ACTN